MKITEENLELLLEVYRDTNLEEKIEEFMFGRCAFFAKALRLFLVKNGEYSETWSLWVEGPSYEDFPPQKVWLHEGLQWKSWFIDIRGLQTKEEVETFWKQVENDPKASYVWKRRSGAVENSSSHISFSDVSGILKKLEEIAQEIG